MKVDTQVGVRVGVQANVWTGIGSGRTLSSGAYRFGPHSRPDRVISRRTRSGEKEEECTVTDTG